jgi:hypothetical protein
LNSIIQKVDAGKVIVDETEEKANSDLIKIIKEVPRPAVSLVLDH